MQDISISGLGCDSTGMQTTTNPYQQVLEKETQINEGDKLTELQEASARNVDASVQICEERYVVSNCV